MVNFTFNTSSEHQFHIPAESMMWDTYLGFKVQDCIFSLLVVYDPNFTRKALLLGEPFFRNFNISLDFDNQILGIEGYKTEEPEIPDPFPEPFPYPDDEDDDDDDDPSIIDDYEQEDWKRKDKDEGWAEHHTIAIILLSVGLVACLVLSCIWYFKRRQRLLR